MDAVESLKALQREMGASKEALGKGAGIFATAVSKELAVKEDEVAVLILTGTGRTLKFVWPAALGAGAAVFPADHKNAFASSVIMTLKGKVDNKLSESKHLRFYESVKGMESSGVPIQKMMALPLTRHKKAFGVVEVSRKGKTPAEAGPNFTQKDAEKLVALCKTLAPELEQLIPDAFI